MAQYNSKYTGAQIEAAVSRALAGGAIDKAIEDAVAEINVTMDGKVPAGTPMLYSLPLADGHTDFRPSYYAKNALNEVWFCAQVQFGAAANGSVSKTMATLPAGFYRSSYFYVPGLLYHNGTWSAEQFSVGSNGNIFPYNTVPAAGDIAICNAVYYV